MPITYDIKKDGFYIRGIKEGEARGEARGEEKNLKHLVGGCQRRGLSIQETDQTLNLPIETVEKYWRKD